MVNILFHYNFFSEMSSYFGFENSRFLCLFVEIAYRLRNLAYQEWKYADFLFKSVDLMVNLIRQW